MPSCWNDNMIWDIINFSIDLSSIDNIGEIDSMTKNKQLIRTRIISDNDELGKDDPREIHKEEI